MIADIIKYEVLTAYIEEMYALHTRSIVVKAAVQQLRGILSLIDDQLKRGAGEPAQLALLLSIATNEVNKAQAESDAISYQVRMLAAAQALQDAFGIELSNQVN